MRKIYTLIFLGLFSLQAISQSIPEYCLENDVVHKYLTEVQYDPNDYTYSNIMLYCDSPSWDNHGVRKDIPKPVPIKLESALDTVSTLYVSEQEDFSDVSTKIMTIVKGADSINVWNLIPGRTYNWKLEYKKQDGTTAQAGSGKFKTSGTLRMLKVDNIFNVRDMGGWPALKGYTMKYGKIIRGSRLNENSKTKLMITSSGINELLWAGMRAELDMRDESNAPMPNGESRHSYLGKDYPIFNVNQGYKSRIATFADGPQTIQGIKQLIAWLKQGKPVYMHCSVGADRTGTVAYMVGALCGMTEDALCKDFELTSFSSDKVVNERQEAHGDYEVLIRQRDWSGRLDPNDTKEGYQFARMVDKIKKNYPGETLQEKVYYHLKTGVQGTKIPEADLNWLINYMIGPIKLTSPSSLTLDKGQTSQMEIVIDNVSPQNPNLTISYSSSNESIATVSSTGLIKAVGCGDATITALTNDGFSQVVKVNVNKIESVVPASFTIGGETFAPKASASNKIKDGSFEYGSFFEWMTAKDTAMTSKYFTLTKYGENVDSVYLESKIDGDEKSEGSIRMEWTTPKNRSFVFGFRVKNSTNVTTTNNENLKIMVTYDEYADDDPRAYIFEYPSYDGNWKEIQYGFTTSSTQNRLRIIFTHLSKDGNNTCFDNFYLIEVDAPNGITAVKPIIDIPKTDDRIFNLSGQEVANPGKGVYIRNGKKYIIR